MDWFFFTFCKKEIAKKKRKNTLNHKKIKKNKRIAHIKHKLDSTCNHACNLISVCLQMNKGLLAEKVIIPCQR